MTYPTKLTFERNLLRVYFSDGVVLARSVYGCWIPSSTSRNPGAETPEHYQQAEQVERDHGPLPHYKGEWALPAPEHTLISALERLLQ
jgi:hypothetical protein